MTILDLILIIILFFFTFSGFWFGLIHTLGALIGTIAGVLVAIVLVFLILEAPYRMRRITAYLDPWKDPLGKGFHIIQSLIAVGSGGFFGLGLGNSRQKFYYLPQQYADFIFAVLCEELGFLGAMAVIFLFAVFIFYFLIINTRAFRKKSGRRLEKGLKNFLAIKKSNNRQSGGKSKNNQQNF